MANNAQTLIVKAIAEAERELARWQRTRDELRGILENLQDGHSRAPRQAERVDRTGEVMVIHPSHTAAAESVLQQAGGPLKMAEIIKRLESDGHPVGDRRRFYASLYTSMSRRKGRFKKAGRGKWTLVRPGVA